MGKLNLSARLKPSWNLKGFTLVELLIVISMIGIMISFLILFLDPFKQIEKARDSQRQQSLKQINSALDTFYNDNSCYPPSLSFGNSWQQGEAVYMKKIPQDPSCTGGGSCYAYVTNTSSSCPAWNILFAKIYQSSVNSPTCALEQLSSCLPSNYYQSGYNYCILSGEVDCAYISSLSLPADAGAGTGGTGGTGGTTPTPTSGSMPTPTPTGVSGCSKDYSCTGNPLRCNVIAPPGSGQYCSSNCDGNCL